MFKWLRKIFPSSKSLQNSAPVKELKPYLKSHCFWSRDHQAVARGVSAGLAACVIPGFQIFYAVLLVILLRGNLPIALLATLVTNPFTVPFITYFIYYIGSYIINDKTSFTFQHFHWDFSSFSAFTANVGEWALQFGKGFLIGLPIVSLCLGIIGYFGTILIWKGYKLINRARL